MLALLHHSSRLVQDHSDIRTSQEQDHDESIACWDFSHHSASWRSESCSPSSSPAPSRLSLLCRVHRISPTHTQHPIHSYRLFNIFVANSLVVRLLALPARQQTAASIGTTSSSPALMEANVDPTRDTRARRTAQTMARTSMRRCLATFHALIPPRA